MCKWYKNNGFKGTLEAQTIQERIAREIEAQEIDEYFSIDEYDIDAESDWEEVEEMMTMFLYEMIDEEEEHG